MTAGETEVQRRYMTSVTANPPPDHWKSHALTDAAILPGAVSEAALAASVQHANHKVC